MNPWMDVALTANVFSVGSVVFGHFEAGTPKWRRQYHARRGWTA